MTTYRVWEVTGSRDFALSERTVRPPGPGEVRLRVLSCGVCHSDAGAVEGRGADSSKPIVPGHELVGIIDAIGEGVTTWRKGERVGVGYLGGNCAVCEQCRRGDFVNCTDQPATGSSVHGGYAEVAYARATGLARIPTGLTSLDASPLLCAGLTVYSALRQLDARPGSIVAVQGIGGLGHLALQYADRLGYRVVAIGRGLEKAALAHQLGATSYVDSANEDPGTALQRLGGAAGMVATAASGSSMSDLVPGLAPRGQLLVVGIAADPISVTTTDLVFGARRVSGSLTGSSIQNEDSLNYAADRGIHPINEVLPFEQAPEAYQRMIEGNARFRMVLEIARADSGQSLPQKPEHPDRSTTR
jgi:propanol-preferring alcohol dehydrogenase